MIGWHITMADGTLRDKRKPSKRWLTAKRYNVASRTYGAGLRNDEAAKFCGTGMHASMELGDAARFRYLDTWSSTQLICLVELSDDARPELTYNGTRPRKWVARRRRVLWAVNSKKAMAAYRRAYPTRYAPGTTELAKFILDYRARWEKQEAAKKRRAASA